MRIALVNPISKRPKTGFAPHLGLGYIAAALKAVGHHVVLLDASLNPPSLLQTVTDHQPALVGVTATSFTMAEAIGVARKVKEALPSTRIVIGGPHVAIAGSSVLEQNADFDFAVVGEGEAAMIELAEAVADGRGPESFSSILGLIFRKDGNVICNERRPWNEQLDQLPFPGFDAASFSQYTQYPLITSRGCPFNCVYCASALVWGRQWRQRQPQSVVDEMEHALETYTWPDATFCITDDTFNLDPERSKDICREIIRRNIQVRFYVQGLRADRVDSELASLLRQAGCLTVAIGIESANRRVLRDMHKGTNLEALTRGIRFLRDADLTVLGQFMIGNPGDTLETIIETIEFARRSKLDQVNFYLALPYPATELWQYVEKNGRFLKHDFTEFHHYSDEPVFETDDFSAEDRTKAYRLALRLSRRMEITCAIRRNLSRISRNALSAGDVVRVMGRGFSAFLYFLIGRRKQW